MPLRSWAAFYREVEAGRLRHYARLVGVTHAKNPQEAQRGFLHAAARVAGRTLGLDLLREGRRLRQRLMRAGLPGVAVETRPADSGANQEKGGPDTPLGTQVRPEQE